MTVQGEGQQALDYIPCRYGNSRVIFRGPKKDLDSDYIAFLGSSETYGRFIQRPFVTQLEDRLGTTCVNFGSLNAGIDLYLNDAAVMELANEAKVCVIQVMGAQNMSNRFFMVHPRRNDRFLRASDRLQALYPEVEFTEFHFNRHMLTALAEVSSERFQQVVDELRIAWVARMRSVITGMKTKVVLLWIADHAPRPPQEVELADNPLFVTPPMLEDLRPLVEDVAQIVPSSEALAKGTEGMIFSSFESTVAEGLVGPMAHDEASDRLEPLLRPLLLP